MGWLSSEMSQVTGLSGEAISIAPPPPLALPPLPVGASAQAASRALRVGTEMPRSAALRSKVRRSTPRAGQVEGTPRPRRGRGP